MNLNYIVPPQNKLMQMPSSSFLIVDILEDLIFLTDSQIKVEEWPVGVCRSGMAVWISMLM